MRVFYEEMKEKLQSILVKNGFDEKRAEESAKNFADSSLDGVYSHGYQRFPRVIAYIQKGYIDVNAVPEKITGFGAVERWDGHLGMGNLNAKMAMQRAVELAGTAWDRYGGDVQYQSLGCAAVPTDGRQRKQDVSESAGQIPVQTCRHGEPLMEGSEIIHLFWLFRIRMESMLLLILRWHSILTASFLYAGRMEKNFLIRVVTMRKAA